VRGAEALLFGFSWNNRHTTDDGGAKEPIRKAIQLRYPQITETELDTFERLYPESDANRAGNALGEANLRCSVGVLCLQGHVH
jgi:hypothetical protein